MSEIIKVPEYMYAWVIREERFGEPMKSMKKERVKIPDIGDDEVLVKNIAAGVNYNGIWAGLGKPKNVVKEQRRYGNNVDFTIPGSESSGIVCKVGKNVTNVKPGDEVFCVGTQFENESDEDPRTRKSFRVWGYENNWGAFAEYSKVQGRQCFKKPKFISWEEAACTIATGTTVYSMLTHWKENEIRKGDVVLIWGGAGGIGSSAIILTKLLGGIPIAVVSSEEKEKYCMEIGAAGCINRNNYDHWGFTNEEFYNDPVKNKKWTKSVLKMRREIWNIAGRGKNPRIVIEHPGKDTFPTSLFLCDSKGMVVTCGATSGFAGSIDLRYLWLGLKRIQGSHAACDYEVELYLNLLKKADKSIPIEKVFNFDEVNLAHQMMYENKVGNGKLVVKIS